ncbi:MAG: tetratricopeptide repeat protein [Chthoniobacter sp.]|uniref:tetratricopeptide repeat protein n=1 Tax=Chthoniobacter sp. TaxID=2510640 RepID=UPI0032A3F9EA
MAALTIEQALQAAIAQHQAGHLAAAEAIYRQILAVQPNHADALHLLGAAALMSGRHEEARDLIERAVALSPDNPAYESNFGEACRRLGRLDEAVDHLRRAVALQPDFADALNNLGSTLALLERWDEAIACLQRCAALRPDHVGTLNNLGLAFMRQDRTQEAAVTYRQLATLMPNSAEAHNNLAEALLKGRCWDEAILCCQRALVLAPDYVEAHGNLGMACLGAGQRDEAVASLERALMLRSDSASLLTGLSAALLERGEYERARQLCERALAVDPGFPLGHWTRSLALLSLGRFEEGWREYEWRWQCPPLSTFRRRFPVPQWDGPAAPGQTILAHAEQGYGDALQFLRYVLLLRQRPGVDRVILECGRPLVRLFASSIGDGVEVFPRETWDGSDLPPFDRHIPWMSLPLALGLFEPQTMAEPYLRADPELRHAWRERLGAGQPFRVGLVWEGNRDHQWYRYRSIAAEKFLPLLRLPGVAFYGWQTEPGNDTPRALVEAGLIDVTANITDFAETAALMAELDLVISVDTAAAHLAGALGRPVWTLLPFVADWRWGSEGEATPWYPGMRLFRQPAEGDWDAALDRVARSCRTAAVSKLNREPA